MNVVAIIPARMESSRFFGKPLKEICGMPMIGHVYKRTKMCDLLSEVYVATCNQEIIDYIELIGGKAIMTGDFHERASDRVAEALQIIESKTKKNIDIIVMVQGDEPMIDPNMIVDGVEPLLKKPEFGVTNLMCSIKTKEEWKDPNEVKVVVDNKNFALYFSREAIPSSKKYDKNITAYKQVCIISFKRNDLINYCSIKPSPLEIIESVDMNRLLENNQKIKMILTDKLTYAVDTPQDLNFVNDLLKDDKLAKLYT